MKTTIAIICLILPSLVLGIKHIAEYHDNPFSKRNFSNGSLVAFVVYLFYICVFVWCGIEGLYPLNEGIGRANDFKTFFVAPGIGFALAIFPRIASKYLFHYASFEQHLSSVLGWAIILYLIAVIAI